MMRISAFGDEIAVDFEEQLAGLRELNIRLIDVRAAWGVNCADFTLRHVARVNQLCAQYGVAVCCMGSPIGKSPIVDPIAIESDRLQRIGETAHQLGTRNIRLFSFYPAAEVDDAAMQESIDRLGALAAIAESMDLLLLLENERGLVGESPEQCQAILRGVASPRLRFIWDPANFAQCGVARQVERYWDDLRPDIGYIHIKDAKLPDEPGAGEARSQVTVAGEGDGQLALLLERLRDAGYEGVLSLEPHLKEARHSSGFSGLDGMAAGGKGAARADGGRRHRGGVMGDAGVGVRRVESRLALHGRRQQLQIITMPRPKDAKIPPVECGDARDTQSLRHRHDAAVNDIKTRVGVGRGDLVDAAQILFQ